MEVSLLHNPKAGDGDWSPDRLIRLLEMSGFAPVHSSTKAKDLDQALEDPHKLVAIAGGDGTVAGIIRALHGRRHVIAILPTGSSNNIARTLGLNEELRFIVAGLAQAKRTPLWIGFIEGPLWRRSFVEAVGLGPFAEAIKADAGDKEHGSHLLQDRREDLRRIVAGCKPIEASIAVDGKRLTEPVLMAEVMNIPMIGPNLLLAPEADAREEKLVLAYLPESRRKAMLRWLKDPEAAGSPLKRIRADKVELHPQGGIVHIDDTVVDGGEATLTIGVESKPVIILIPGDDE